MTLPFADEGVTKCRSCGAPIIWAKSATTGSAMPIDAAPVPMGNIVLSNGLAYVVQPDEAEDRPLYVSHFSSCKFASEHRKPRKRTRQ